MNYAKFGSGASAVVIPDDLGARFVSEKSSYALLACYPFPQLLTFYHYSVLSSVLQNTTCSLLAVRRANLYLVAVLLYSPQGAAVY